MDPEIDDEKEFDPEVMGFGFAPMSWGMPVGNVLVVASDGTDLGADFAHCLADYATTKVVLIVRKDSEAEVSYEETLKKITPTKFLEHWKSCRHASRLPV